MKKGNKLQEMQFLEQNLQNLLLQKQAFQMESSETASALGELEKSGEDVFKVIGQLMIKSEKSRVKEELLDKQRILDLRLSSIDKQESSFKEKLDKIRDEIIKEKNG